MKTFKKIKSKLVLYKAYFRLQMLLKSSILKLADKILNCKVKNYENLLLIIRKEIDKKFKSDSMEFRINLSIGIAKALLPFNGVEFDDFEEMNMVFISYEKAVLIEKARIKEFVINHFLLKAYYASLHDKEKEKHYFDILREYDSEAKLLEKDDFIKLNRYIIKNNSVLKSEHKLHLKEIREIEKIQQIEPLDFSFNDIKALLGIASILFLISGFIFNWIYLGRFGIKISYYFSIQDYIASSLDELTKLIISFIISLVFGFIWWSPGYIESRKVMTKRRLFFEDFPMNTIAISFPIIAAIQIMTDGPLKYAFLGFTIFVIYLECSSKLYRFFKKPFIAFLAIFYVGFYCSFIIGPTMDKADNIIKRPDEYKDNYEITLNSNDLFDRTNTYLLSANSNYVFLYDRKKDNSIIIPRSEVKFIQNKNNMRENFFDKLKKIYELF